MSNIIKKINTVNGTAQLDYNEALVNLPKINGQELKGDITLNLPSGDGGGITDVKINDTSIVQDGVANIPTIGDGVTFEGLVKLYPDDYKNGAMGSLKYDTSGPRKGCLSVNVANEQAINNRWNSPIGANYLDLAVKKALTDGKGEVYTSEEQQAAQERLGLGWKLLGDVTLEEDEVKKIDISIDNPNYNEYQVYVSLKRNSNASSNMMIGFDGVTSTSFVPTYIGVGTNQTYILYGYIMRNCNKGWLSNVWGSVTGEPCNVSGSKAVRYYTNSANTNTEKPNKITLSVSVNTLDTGTQFIVYAR